MSPTMTTPAAKHGGFTIERTYDAPPERVFRAFSDAERKARWFAGPASEWTLIERKHDFRAGGTEVLHGRFVKSGMESKFVCRYHEIIPNERLVYVYDMHVNGSYMSVSLATVELTPTNGGTHLKFTEQAVYVDGKDGNADRERGTAALFDALGASLTD
jgi:uncharacterized protein YndB with AHSA1/START domain